MSKPVVPLFQVALRHLSADVKKAGATLPDAQLNHVSVKQIRTMLDSAAALAPGVVYPTEPELRFTGPSGKFVVQIKAGNLNFISWSAKVKIGGVVTPAQIIDAITGENQEQEYSTAPVARDSSGGGFRPSLNMAALVVAIIAVNSFTFWFLTSPPRTLVPKFTLMAPEPAERLLSDIAGAYETGGGPGDRRLEIQRNGGVQRIKFGAQRTVALKQTYTVKAAAAGGKPALLTDRKSLITIKDPQTLVLFGDTYQRVPQ